MIHIFRNKKTVIALGLMSVVLICCKSTQYLLPTDVDVTVAQARWPGTNMTDLNQGYDIFTDACTDCHGQKKPQKFSEAKWIQIMHTMGHKAKLDSTRYNLVLHYILTKRETVLGVKK